ncbi:MAG TPA: sugar ABC transporter permease [Candidatus Eisenbergiella merdavium]|uniref:Sugar ABC transporter permease n=1 Tax=Candidatus Eisenbergiella merdavium TaxID=2838551 RepID=A0A9D2NHS7_9FIRM|nr:sugar ABC transporter permease [Candidatus Eisenbergiella merdavium]
MIRKLKKNKGLFFILPWIIGFLWFQLYPFVKSFYYSFTNYTMLNEPKFVGLTNYIRLLTSDLEFWPSMKVTATYALIVVPCKLAFALFIAMLLNMKIKGIGLFRTLYYLPSILGGSIAIAVVWKILFMRNGAINNLLGMIGIGPVDWIGSPKTALGTICVLSVWQFGSSMVLFLAALKQVPQSLYEAAIIDGAGRVQRFFKITLPMITPILFFNLIMQMINALQEFTSAFVITGGGPMKSTYVLGMKLYTDAFQYYKMGYASALSWIMFVLIICLTMLVFRSSSAWVYYEDGGEF